MEYVTILWCFWINKYSIVIKDDVEMNDVSVPPLHTYCQKRFMRLMLMSSHSKLVDTLTKEIVWETMDPTKFLFIFLPD